MKMKTRKPRGTANSKHLRTKETIGASVNTVDGPNTSCETESCISNEAYGLSIPPSHSETHGAPWHEQQTEDDDGYVISQLDYTDPKTSASAANAIPTTSNVAYGIYSIPTTCNEACKALGCQYEQQTASQADHAEVSDPLTSNTLSSDGCTIPTTSNVAYGLHSISTAHNEAYGALGHQCEQQTACQADYAEVSEPPNSNTSSSAANTISTTSNVAYGLHGISTAHNEAYMHGALGHQHEQQTASQMNYAGPPNSNTSSSAASTILTSSNVPYNPCSIPTTHNEAYGVLGYQHEQQRETDDMDECVANQYLEIDADDIWNSVMHATATDLHS